MISKSPEHYLNCMKTTRKISITFSDKYHLFNEVIMLRDCLTLKAIND